MSKTLKQKVRHIFYNKDGKLNLRIPFKLRWSYINHIRRRNREYGEFRAIRSNLRDKIGKADMKSQIKEL